MLDLRRRTHWDVAFVHYVDTPPPPELYRWGRLNCALWVAGALDVMCVDAGMVRLLSDIYGEADSFDDVLGGLDVPVSEMLNEWFGPPVPRRATRRGDLLFSPSRMTGDTSPIPIPTFALAWGFFAYVVLDGVQPVRLPVDSLYKLFPELLVFPVG